MKAFERYFSLYPSSFCPPFSSSLSLIVIIPVFDDPDVFFTLDSLLACRCGTIRVGVILVVNHACTCPPMQKERNFRLFIRLKEYIAGKKTDSIEFCVIEAFDLPDKESGVGAARKIAMDAGAFYFYRQQRPQGIIASLDADTTVEENYFTALYEAFRQKQVAGVSVYYEHPVEGLDTALREAIVKYELYLRYYCRALKYTGHPYAYSCIGSAFAVRVCDYVAQGGMNKRQAGEDFYFLQKLIATGRYFNLNTTTVYPSARLSERTPFGTGQSVKQILQAGGRFYTYPMEAFRELKCFFDRMDELYRADVSVVRHLQQRQPRILADFLLAFGLEQVVDNVNANVASLPLFRKKFFDRFNAFRVLKYLNYRQAQSGEKQEITEAVNELFESLCVQARFSCDDQLKALRQWDKTERR